MALANLALAAVLWAMERPLEFWITAGNGTRAAQLGLSVAAGGVVYFGALLALGVRPSQLKLRNEN